MLERKASPQALKGHFIIDQYLSVLMPKNYTSIQEDITRKSEIDILFSNKRFRY